MLRRLIIAAWLLSLGSASAAPLPSADGVSIPGVVGIRLQRLGIEHGLSQATARTLAQDGEGMLWIGTQDGLNRFDGQEFRVFRRESADPRSLSDNHVTALEVDAVGVLWVGTQSGGLGRYDPDTRAFDNFPVAAGRVDALAAVPVHAIAPSADGRLWIGSGRGNLQRLNASRTRFDSIPVPREVQVRALLALPGGDMLVASTHGLWRWSASDLELRAFGDLPPDVADVQALAKDARGHLWIGSAAHGVFELDPQGRRVRQLDDDSGLAGEDVRALLVDREQRVWIGTYTGLSRIDAPQAEPRSWRRDDARSDGLGSERISALSQDRDGLVWIGTWLGGAYVHLPGSEAFVEYRAVAGDARTLPGSAVRALHVEADGTLWLGIQEGGGLVHLDPARGVVKRHRPQPQNPGSLASDRVQAVVRDLDGSLWVGSVDAGLNRQRRSSESFERLPADPADPTRPRGSNVLAMYVDRAGTLWVGYQDSGMDALCRGCDRFQRHEHLVDDNSGLPGQNIGAVFESSIGELWVGARPGGLSRMDRSSGRFTPVESLLQTPADLRHLAVTWISESRSGDLWIGTQGAGVLRLGRRSGGRLHPQFYTYRDGLAAEAVGSIIEDARGAMWASTTSGISRIDPDSGRIENFDARSGAQPDGYFVNAGGRLPDGRIVFGGLRGLTLFDPSVVVSRVLLPRPAITDVRVFQSPRPGEGAAWRYRRGADGAADRLWLRAGTGGFGVSFSALAFAAPELVQYSYRLEPIDVDWIESTARQRNAGYPHLPPGDYRLRLRTRYPGEPFGPERVVDVQLDPLWWQSAWARAGLLLLFAAPIAVWAWSRGQRQRERARGQRELADSEQRLKLALWGTGDEFWDVDLASGRLIRMNPLQHLRVTHEATEETVRGFAPFVHPDDVEAFSAAMRAHYQGVAEDLDHSYRVRDVDGNWRWLRSRGRAVERADDGRVLRMAGTTQDVTALREHAQTLAQINQQLEGRVAERTADLTRLNGELVRTIDDLRLAQHQLVEAEKLAALGGLVAGIAHEVNTPLGVGVTAASHLEQQAKFFAARVDSGDIDAVEIDQFRRVVLECSSMVLRNLQRADRMVRSFKQVAVDQASEVPRTVDVRAYLEEILVSLQPLLKRCRQRVSIDVAEGLLVTLLPGALYQIIVNLTTNALTHAFEGRDDGAIRISAQREGDLLRLEFSDNGCGMDEEVRRRLFEPFFTTRRGQGGSGLGMHIVYNLAVQGLGGSIDCETAPGQGTRFVLRIPLQSESATG